MARYGPVQTLALESRKLSEILADISIWRFVGLGFITGGIPWRKT